MVGPEGKYQVGHQTHAHVHPEKKVAEPAVKFMRMELTVHPSLSFLSFFVDQTLEPRPHQMQCPLSIHKDKAHSKMAAVSRDAALMEARPVHQSISDMR